MYAFNGLWPFLSLALICRLYMANRLCIRQLVSDRTSIFTYLQGSAYNTIYARKCKCKSSTPLLFKLSTSLLLSTSYVISTVFLHKSYAAASNTEDYDAIVFHDDVINSALLAFALLALCAGNSRWSVNSPTKASGAEPWCLFFYLRLNKRLSKQSWGWWFETQSCPLWRHCNVMISVFQEPILA